MASLQLAPRIPQRMCTTRTDQAIASEGEQRALLRLAIENADGAYFVPNVVPIQPVEPKIIFPEPSAADCRPRTGSTFWLPTNRNAGDLSED